VGSVGGRYDMVEWGFSSGSNSRGHQSYVTVVKEDALWGLKMVMRSPNLIGEERAATEIYTCGLRWILKGHRGLGNKRKQITKYYVTSGGAFFCS
jgi:hypothetical protein